MNVSPGRVSILTVCLTLPSCSPWTVRPIDDSSDRGSSGPAALSPAAYADSIWSSKLIPAVLGAAVDSRTLLNAIAESPEKAIELYARRQESGQAYYAIKGQGRVLRVDTQSRFGLAYLDIPPFDGRADLTIQIGPVMRGTSLRDCSGIVRFTDFVNQLQYADVANALNDLALRTVLAPLDKAALKGRLLSFAGAAAAEARTDPPLRDLAPVQLSIEGSN